METSECKPGRYREPGVRKFGRSRTPQQKDYTL